MVVTQNSPTLLKDYFNILDRTLNIKFKEKDSDYTISFSNWMNLLSILKTNWQESELRDKIFSIFDEIGQNFHLSIKLLPYIFQTLTSESLNADRELD